MGATATTPIDVAVVGGGPAGAATAWPWLARLHGDGPGTLRYDAFRIGETLPPAVKRPLMELGVWDRFLATGTLESPGIVRLGAGLIRTITTSSSIRMARAGTSTAAGLTQCYAHGRRMGGGNQDWRHRDRLGVPPFGSLASGGRRAGRSCRVACADTR